MSLIDKSLEEYVNDVDSDLPAPGGGSVASLVGALGVALAKMLGHFSINKKKFAAASKKEQEKFLLVGQELDYFKQSLMSGVDDDKVAYEAVIAAFKSKDEEQIQVALKSAAFTAFDIETAAFNAIKLLDKMVKLGNKNVLSDLVSGAILLASCVEMCHLNVVANASMLVDEETKTNYIDASNRMVKEAATYKKKVINKVNKL